MRWPLLAFLLGTLARSPAHTLAIKDATIQLAPLLTVEHANLVVEDGLVTGVGPKVSIPADAEVVDGKGLFVYAGFIDGSTTLGLPDTKRSPEEQKLAEGEKPDFTKEAPPSIEPANRKGLRPELDSARFVRLSEADARKAHAGGFALAVIHPADEFLSGRSAILTLSGAPRRTALLPGSPMHHASFKSYGEGYPSTLMGTIAHFRQVFQDARHYQKVWEAYRPGQPRPPVDPALEALGAVLRGEARLFFEADTDRDIYRALALSEEFGFRLGLSGGQEAWRLAPLLREKDIPVVLNLGLPKEFDRPKEEAPEPERIVKERERLRNERLDAALRLHEAKVHFAFSSRGLGAASEVLGSVASRIARGLPQDAALAALTTSPARILGLQATQGTIGPGRTANLAVLSAPLGEKSAQVRYLVADGHLFVYPAPAAASPPKPEAAQEKEARSLAQWDIELPADRKPRSPTGGSVLIKNATLITMSDPGTLENSSLLVVHGKIREIGRTIAAPAGTREIDGAGLFVVPGLVDCHSHIATEGGLNEGTQSVTPEVRVRDVLNPEDPMIYRGLAGGVTAANILHGSANTIGGQNATIKLKYGVPPRELPFPGAPRGVKFALGENPKQSNFDRNRGKRFPNTRPGVEATFRRAFLEAQEYQAARKKNPLLRLDLRLEALSDILSGELLIHCHCYRADEILMMLGVAKEHGLHLATLQHVLEGYRVAPEIAQSGVGCSTFSDWWSYKLEAFEAIPYNAALLTRAGILTSINSDLPEPMPHLNVEASKSIKYGGLSETEALATVTLNPSRQLGIDRRVGSLEPGKDGDLAIYNGHPLSPYSRCVMTLVDGEIHFEAGTVPNHATPDFRPGARPRRLPGPLLPGATFAIRDAEIHPVSQPSFRGTIVFSGGRITQMGSGVQPPPGSQTLDGSGLSVYPGLIDAHTSLGLSEIGSVQGSRDDQEIGGLQPDLRALTGVNPHSELIPVTRANGITTALTAPRGTGFAGQSAVIHLAGWTPREMAVRETFALHVEYPVLREGEMSRDSKESKDAKEEHEKKLKELKDALGAAQRYTGSPRDLKLEALLPFVRGERPVVIEADGIREIQGALKLAQEFGLKLILSGAREAWKAAAELAEKKIPVIVGGTMDPTQRPYDPYDSVYRNPARLARAGVLFAISSAESFSGNARNTPYHAAWAAAYGLSREEALRSVTIHPAKILGLEGEIGSLEVGKRADLIVTTGDPLEVVTDIVYEFIGGQPVSLESKHTRSYEKFRDRRGEPKK